MTPRTASSPSARRGRQFGQPLLDVAATSASTCVEDLVVDADCLCRPLHDHLQVDADVAALHAPLLPAAGPAARALRRPAGRRQRTSSPRALTLFASQVQATAVGAGLRRGRTRSSTRWLISSLFRNRQCCRRSATAVTARGDNSRLFRVQPLTLPAPAGDVPVVLVERSGKGVAAGAVGDEVELVAARGCSTARQRRAAGIGDRPRRQPVDDVGVVGRSASADRSASAGGALAAAAVARHRPPSDRPAAACPGAAG